jgi:hypothetical protein
MAKAGAFFVVMFVLLLYPICLVAVHLELILSSYPAVTDLQSALWPFAVIRQRGFSIGAALGVALAAAAAAAACRAWPVRRWRWASEEQFRRLIGGAS